MIGPENMTDEANTRRCVIVTNTRHLVERTARSKGRAVLLCPSPLGHSLGSCQHKRSVLGRTDAWFVVGHFL